MCGALILPTEVKATGGVCWHCKRQRDKDRSDERELEHYAELLDKINELRQALGLSAFAYDKKAPRWTLHNLIKDEANSWEIKRAISTVPVDRWAMVRSKAIMTHDAIEATLGPFTCLSLRNAYEIYLAHPPDPTPPSRIECSTYNHDWKFELKFYRDYDERDNYSWVCRKCGKCVTTEENTPPS